MNSSKFLVGRLNDLIDRLPSILCRYEYDETSNNHLVELICSDDSCSEQFKQEKTELLRDFRRIYPMEGLLYITSETLSKIKHPTFERIGEYYGQMAFAATHMTE